MTLRRFILLAGSDPFLPETRALLRRMDTVPPLPRQILIDQTIRGLFSAGVWDTFDVLYFLAAHDAQAALLNWKADAHNLALVSGTVTFTADVGYRSASGGVLQVSSSPAVPKWQTGDAALSVWAADGASGPFLVQGGAGSIVAPLGSGSSEGSLVVSINQSQAQVVTPPSPDPDGLFTGSRYDGAAFIGYNGELYQNLTEAENNPAGPGVSLLRGSPFLARFLCAGGGRSVAQEALLYGVVSAYLGGL